MDDEVLGEVATAEVIGEQWVMKFNGHSTANLRGAGVVLYHKHSHSNWSFRVPTILQNMRPILLG